MRKDGEYKQISELSNIIHGSFRIKLGRYIETDNYKLQKNHSKIIKKITTKNIHLMHILKSIIEVLGTFLFIENITIIRGK